MGDLGNVTAGADGHCVFIREDKLLKVRSGDNRSEWRDMIRYNSFALNGKHGVSLTHSSIHRYGIWLAGLLLSTPVPMTSGKEAMNYHWRQETLAQGVYESLWMYVLKPDMFYQTFCATTSCSTFMHAYRIACGIIARSAGLFENSKKVRCWYGLHIIRNDG